MSEKAKNKKPGVKSFIGGTILTDERVTKQIPFILFLAFLGLLMITNRNWSERTIRKVEILQDTIDNLKSESTTLSSKLMNASRPSEVAKKVEQAGLDLKEPVRPPKKLNVKKEIEDKFVPAFDPVKGLLVSGFPMPLFTTNGTLAVLTDMSKLESLYAGIERYKAVLLLCEPFYVTLARNNVSKNICFVHRILGDSLSSAIIYKNVPLITSILPYRNKGNFIEETQEMNWLLSQGLKNSGANFEQIVKTTICLDSRLTPPTELERKKYKTFNVEFKTISSYIKF